MNPGSHPNYALNILVGFILPLVPQTYRCFRVEPRRTPQSQRATRLLSWPHQTLLMLTVAPLGDTDCSLSFLLLPSQPPPLLTSAQRGPTSSVFPVTVHTKAVHIPYPQLSVLSITEACPPASCLRPSTAPPVTLPLENLVVSPRPSANAWP